MNDTVTEPGKRPLDALLLEDSRFDAELLRASLSASHPEATLTVVDDEEGFVAALAARRFDVILSDYELPGYSGGQALAHARATSPRTPFIFVSGVIGEDNAVEMLKRGATDYVSKGRLSRLSVVIDRALREVDERAARDRAESQLREADAVYARVVNTLRDYAVILLDPHGVISGWNTAARDIFGHDRNAAIGSPLAMLYLPEDREAGVPQAEMAAALAGGKANDERWMLRADGSRLRAEGVVAPLYADSGQHSGFCKVVHDGTGAWEAAHALRLAKEEAERANLAKDRFLAVLSHELRTPLAPIASAAHVLERCAEVPARYAGLLPLIKRNVALEARLINDLLDMSAITAGSLSLHLAPVDFHGSIDAAIEALADEIADRRITLERDLAAPDATLELDEHRMQQVLGNLLRNALKFTPPGGRIRVATHTADGLLCLRITDSGVGIDPEALPRIFNAFEQADRDLARREGGLGLGLAIAQGLVEGHAGHLRAESPGVGRGASFILSLPTRRSDSGAATQPRDGPADKALLPSLTRTSC